MCQPRSLSLASLVADPLPDAVDAPPSDLALATPDPVAPAQQVTAHAAIPPIPEPPPPVVPPAPMSGDEIVEVLTLQDSFRKAVEKFDRAQQAAAPKPPADFYFEAVEKASAALMLRVPQVLATAFAMGLPEEYQDDVQEIARRETMRFRTGLELAQHIKEAPHMAGQRVDEKEVRDAMEKTLQSVFRLMEGIVKVTLARIEAKKLAALKIEDRPASV